MSLEDSQVIAGNSTDPSVIKRPHMKKYHQQGAQLKDSNQGIDFLFGENDYLQKM